MLLRLLRYIMLFVSLMITAKASADIEVNATNFPDETFRNWVLKNISGAKDSLLSSSEIAWITDIDCSGPLGTRGDIISLKGIEYFTALKYLKCSFNQLSSLNVSKNTDLKTLDCSYNLLTSLDVNENTILYTLRCTNNQLTSIDISKNTALNTLDCSSNQLSTLDVSKNTSLTTLNCSYNQLLSLDVNYNADINTLDCSSNFLSSLDVSNNTALTELRCSDNRLPFLDVSRNTFITVFYCYNNQLTTLDLSNNTGLKQFSCANNQLLCIDLSKHYSLFINLSYQQSTTLTAISINTGIAIPVPTDFNLTRVENLKLSGKTVTGSISIINDQKYLVFSQNDIPEGDINGKKLTYYYNGIHSSLNVSINLIYVANSETSVSLSIHTGIGGSVSFDGNTISNTTESFVVEKGSSITITISPNKNYRLATLTFNNNDVTKDIYNNQYIITEIYFNTIVVATFEEDLTSFSLKGINYQMTSAANKTLNVNTGNYSGHVIIPASISYEGETWSVKSSASGVFNKSSITAITWNPEYAISSNAFGSQTNPNLLLYVKSTSYAPSNIQNVIANGKAKKIVLTDAASGNNFDCPEAFTAEEISYSHKYCMTSGINESRGWETIALPFTVRTVTHESKGTLVPFKAFSGNNLPFWLYEWSSSGFVEASSIEANTPYIISFPNNEHYYTDYNISGNITFSSNNVTISKSADLNIVSGKGYRFVPNYSTLGASTQIFPLNVQNDYSTHTDYYAEGSTFIKELRTVHPFEAYLTTSGSNAKRAIPIFEELPTAIHEIPVIDYNNEKGLRVYTMAGNLVLSSESMTLQEVLKRLPAGVYIVNGKKMVVR